MSAVLTQEAAFSNKVSKQRSTITNYLRLLKLPVEIQLGVREGDITMGHARALINIEDPDKQLAIYQQIVLNDLSVRDVEDIARGAKSETASTTKSKTEKKETAKTALSFEQKQMLDDLRAVFNAKVLINKDEKGKGKIVIPFKSDNDLKRILDLLDA
jgi:ParB family chromosome partitioning protein